MGPGRAVATSAAIRPSALAAPVRTTVPAARPGDHDRAGERLLAGGPGRPARDSPVSADSSSRSRYASTQPQVGRDDVAGLEAHQVPADQLGGGQRPASWPSRTTRAVGAASWSSAAIARSARTSCATPMAVLTTTTSAITAASVAVAEQRW